MNQMDVVQVTQLSHRGSGLLALVGTPLVIGSFERSYFRAHFVTAPIDVIMYRSFKADDTD